MGHKAVEELQAREDAIKDKLNSEIQELTADKNRM